ncbi:hypothetical protein RclHR1_04790011 [Rhizophagus clarus]|uniref:Uncharacterized protein n=1 Tax=Rhizophagus clarus TaxID=94130 RepID=A0A2Z6S1X6_9GLOM|nr:hypothetical protein RclHR1_04790011 [Rhizophagus clarus]
MILSNILSLYIGRRILDFLCLMTMPLLLIALFGIEILERISLMSLSNIISTKYPSLLSIFHIIQSLHPLTSL